VKQVGHHTRTSNDQRSDAKDPTSSEHNRLHFLSILNERYLVRFEIQEGDPVKAIYEKVIKHQIDDNHDFGDCKSCNEIADQGRRPITTPAVEEETDNDCSNRLFTGQAHLTIPNSCRHLKGW
jgi:hypothetical protein